MLAVHIFKFCPRAIADLSLIWQQPLYFRCIYSEGITPPRSRLRAPQARRSRGGYPRRHSNTERKTADGAGVQRSRRPVNGFRKPSGSVQSQPNVFDEYLRLKPRAARTRFIRSQSAAEAHIGVLFAAPGQVNVGAVIQPVQP